MFSGCSSTFIKVDETNISAETKLSTVPEKERELIIALNKPTVGVNVFNKASAITVNGYRILFSSGSDEIFILKNKEILVGVSGDERYIFGPEIEAPIAGGELVLVSGDYIKYHGKKYVFEDHGLDGIDVKYEFKNSLNADSFVNGKKCEKTIVAGAACCTNSSGELGAYRFTPSTGWELTTNPKLIANCQKNP